MGRIFMLAFLLLGSQVLLAQHTASNQFFTQRHTVHDVQKKINFDGQWRGGFNETSLSYPGDYNTVYVLELTTEGSRVFGYSYTYFNSGPKKYYTICRLTGTLNRENNEVNVTEVERVKYNTPPEFQNCFQTHKLYYEKGDDNTEVLRGTWKAAPNQTGNCGSGITVLSRRITNRLPFGLKPKENTDIVKATPKKVPQKKPTETILQKNTPPVAKKAPDVLPEKEQAIKITPEKTDSETKPVLKNISPVPNKLESRRKDIVRSIQIENPTFQLDFYDNGEIDGDSISVFYNGKLLLSNKRLTDRPITLKLEIDKHVHENIITMYADNLGSIPPNTAVMIVTDGNKRYEVRITSDTEKSGSVIFTQK